MKSRVSVPDRAREAAPLVSRRITRASAKKKGSLWEKQVVEHLKETTRWLHVERRAKEGKNDRGDIAGLPAVIECKNTSSLDLAQAVDEMKRECAAAGELLGAVFMRRRNQPTARGYAVMEIWQFMLLLQAWDSLATLRGTSEGG